jgi:hypothetical protein
MTREKRYILLRIWEKKINRGTHLSPVNVPSEVGRGEGGRGGAVGAECLPGGELQPPILDANQWDAVRGICAEESNREKENAASVIILIPDGGIRCMHVATCL